MSHFIVGIIVDHPDIDLVHRALAPYQENNMGDCPAKFLEFTDMQEELLEHYDVETEEVKNNYPTFDLYAKDYMGYEFNRRTKTYGYWSNPEAKWDWYNICSHNNFSRYKQADPDETFIKIKDLPKDRDQNEYDEAIKFWEYAVEGKPLEEDKKPFFIYEPEYYIELYGTKENYATIESTPHYWAFIYKDNWYEKGEMGWWAMSNSTKAGIVAYFEEWLKIINDPANQEKYIAVANCHI